MSLIERLKLESELKSTVSIGKLNMKPRKTVTYNKSKIGNGKTCELGKFLLRLMKKVR